MCLEIIVETKEVTVDIRTSTTLEFEAALTDTSSSEYITAAQNFDDLYRDALNQMADGFEIKLKSIEVAFIEGGPATPPPPTAAPSSTCPSKHPWAYQDGNYCCAENKEKIATEHGSLCDGSSISIESKCCANNDYAACASPPCANNPNPSAAPTAAPTPAPTRQSQHGHHGKRRKRRSTTTEVVVTAVFSVPVLESTDFNKLESEIVSSTTTTANAAIASADGTLINTDVVSSVSIQSEEEVTNDGMYDTVAKILTLILF